MAISLCHVDDIPQGGSRGFDIGRVRLFAVRKRNEVHLYLNRCPHLGLSLDWEPDSFLDSEGRYIRCSNHGAVFDIDTGNCIKGPCLGDALWALNYSIDDGVIMIPEEELPEVPSPG